MLEFKESGLSKSGKTKTWLVIGNGIELGQISFFGRWRKYCFYPNSDTLLDHLCLTEIAWFCKLETNKVFKR